jgi:Gas vesicle protein
VKRPRTNRPAPPKLRKPSTVPPPHGHSTVPENPPLRAPKPPRPKRRSPTPKPALRAPKTGAAPKRQVGRIIDEDEASLVDLIDNLLSKGVMLNADLILALADVDLVYIRLSALLCAADRVLPHLREGDGGLVQRG